MIQHIERADDPRLAPYADVGHHARLRERGLCVAEGRTVLRRLAEAERFELHSVVLSPAAYDDLRSLVAVLECPVYVCATDVLQTITGFDFHRGCLALAKRPDESASMARFVSATRLLALEGVGNPDNVGGLFRVAQAFAVDGVLLAPSAADPLYRKAIRTSMGAVLRVPFVRAERWPAALAELRAAGFSVIGLAPAAGAISMSAFAASVDADARLALLLGAEGPGLTHEAMLACDGLVRIPIDPAVDSLNVVVAAGIALAFLQAR